VLRLHLRRISADCPFFTLSLARHCLPIHINPIDNELELYDHFIVVPCLARLCLYIGVVHRPRSFSMFRFKMTAEETSSMERINWPHVKAPISVQRVWPTSFSRHCYFIHRCDFIISPSLRSATSSVKGLSAFDHRLLPSTFYISVFTTLPLSTTTTTTHPSPRFVCDVD
jgi:hypothetical protein